jgi:hypothetical protein
MALADRDGDSLRRLLQLRGGGGQEDGGGVAGGVVEVDFFDEADGELVIQEPHVLGGVHAGGTVLAEPPEGQGAEDSKGRVRELFDSIRGEDIGPDDGITVEGGGAVGQAPIDALVGGGFESGEMGLPGGIEIIGGQAAVESGFVDVGPEGAEIVEGRRRRRRLARV